jgi:hypothetical protein
MCIRAFAPPEIKAQKGCSTAKLEQAVFHFRTSAAHRNTCCGLPACRVRAAGAMLEP